jgi:hypothetical protein
VDFVQRRTTDLVSLVREGPQLKRRYEGGPREMAGLGPLVIGQAIRQRPTGAPLHCLSRTELLPSLPALSGQGTTSDEAIVVSRALNGELQFGPWPPRSALSN